MPSAVWYVNGNANIVKDNIKYKYDNCGNIAEIIENGKLSVRYEYDLLNRLVREDNKKLGKTWVYGYDRNGNITVKREFAFTLRDREQLEELEGTEKLYSYKGDRLITYNGEIISYDRYGNSVIYKGETLEWEYGKRLKKYGEKTFGYDGLGRRKSKGEAGFTYDNDGKLIKQSNGIEFIYDNGGIAGLKYNGTEYIYRKNVLGDITHILDMNGNVIAEYAYDAWGKSKVIKDTDGIAEANPFRYRSYYYDVETRLYYLQTRYYDPEVGRFISQDDVSYLDPNSINGLNLYAYCGDNPVMGYDPDGTWDWRKFWGAIVIFASAASLSVGIALCATGVGAPVGSILIGAGIGGLFGSAGSAISQGIQNGWNNIDWGQIAIDGGAGFITGALIASPLGGLATGIGVGVITFVQSTGSDLYQSNGDWDKVNWNKAAFQSIFSGTVSGIGKYLLQNVNLMNKFVNSMPSVKVAAEIAKNIGLAGRLSYTNLWMQFIIYRNIYNYVIKAVVSILNTIFKSIPIK